LSARRQSEPARTAPLLSCPPWPRPRARSPIDWKCPDPQQRTRRPRGPPACRAQPAPAGQAGCPSGSASGAAGMIGTGRCRRPRPPRGQSFRRKRGGEGAASGSKHALVGACASESMRRLKPAQASCRKPAGRRGARETRQPARPPLSPHPRPGPAPDLAATALTQTSRPSHQPAARRPPPPLAPAPGVRLEHGAAPNMVNLQRPGATAGSGGWGG
jgi:translation initiation factor IF-2